MQKRVGAQAVCARPVLLNLLDEVFGLCVRAHGFLPEHAAHVLVVDFKVVCLCDAVEENAHFSPAFGFLARVVEEGFLVLFDVFARGALREQAHHHFFEN